MSDGTGIGWTSATWNPVVGCTHVSAGCDNCYAAELTGGRLSKLPLYAGLAAGGKFTGEVRLVPERLSLPYSWRKPRRVFVASMADLFHKDVPDGFIAHVWHVMAQCPQHTFQILTKRHDRMKSWVNRWTDRAADVEVARAGGGLPPMPRGPEAVRATYPSGRGQLFAAMLDSMGTPPPGAAYPLYDWAEGQIWWPRVLPNVWLGVSAEDQRWASIRVPALVDTPAAVRFVSLEPLLGPIDMDPWLHDPTCLWMAKSTCTCERRGARVNWVIAGGESGPRRRPMQPDWVRSLRDQVRNSEASFFFKQWGGRTPKAGGNELDGRVWEQFPDDAKVAST